MYIVIFFRIICIICIILSGKNYLPTYLPKNGTLPPSQRSPICPTRNNFLEKTIFYRFPDEFLLKVTKLRAFMAISQKVVPGVDSGGVHTCSCALRRITNIFVKSWLMKWICIHKFYMEMSSEELGTF